MHRHGKRVFRRHAELNAPHACAATSCSSLHITGLPAARARGISQRQHSRREHGLGQPGAPAACSVPLLWRWGTRRRVRERRLLADGPDMPAALPRSRRRRPAAHPASAPRDAASCIRMRANSTTPGVERLPMPCLLCVCVCHQHVVLSLWQVRLIIRHR